MENQKIMYGIGGLVLGGILMFLIVGNSGGKDSSMNPGMMEKKPETAMIKEDTPSQSGMSMEAMNEELKNKTGDEFDKAFIELMIEHHQGAIDMANLIGTRAKHQEIKNLGKDIVVAQTKEIKEMAEWAKAWGYTNDEVMMKDDAVGQGMMH